MGATVIDFDLDGDLDIYVINYIEQSRLLNDDDGNVIGFDHDCANNFLYVNEGNMRFTESAMELGAQGQGCGLAVTSINFFEGKPAIYIANDFGEWIHPNELLIYDHDSGVFTDRATQYGLDYGLYGMGIAIGDPDRDEDFDIYVSNLGQNAYLVGDSQMNFIERSVENGIDNTWSSDSTLAISWGVLFFDQDNDGWQDLFVSNGWIPSAEFIKSGFDDPSKYYNNQSGQFVDLTDSFDVGFDYVNRGVVYTDMDNNGIWDIVLSGLDASVDPEGERKFRVLKNQSSAENNFISITLKGTSDSRDGFGALIDLHTGGEKMKQLSFPNGTFCSQSSRKIHFGLEGVNEIDSIKILWPNGWQDVIYDLPINQHLEIEEGGTIEILGCIDNDDPNYNSIATKNSGCKFDNSTSTHSTVIDSKIKIFPTIVHAPYITVHSTISLQNARLSVYDILGRLNFSRTLNLLEGDYNHIQLPSAMPASIYSIQIEAENKLVFQDKLIRLR